MITRSFGNAFEVQDWTEELQLVPEVRTPLSDFNLFREEAVSQHSITFEETSSSLGLILDVVRGAKPLANQDENRKLRSYVIPHQKILDYIAVGDVQGKRAYGSTDAAETEAAVMERKMARIRKSFTISKEVARFHAITQGAIWAPNGTVVGNYYTDFGVTRKVVGFDLGTAGTDILAKIEQVIAHMQDNAQTGDLVSGIVGMCSPEFFQALITHPKIAAAYQYYSSIQEPLRNRVGGAGLYREFSHGGIVFREIRDTAAGQRYIPANEAYFVPVGTDDTFITYYGPGNKLDLANTLGEPVYMWVYSDPKGEKKEIEAESNMIHLIRRPQLVVKATVAA